MHSFSITITALLLSLFFGEALAKDPLPTTPLVATINGVKVYSDKTRLTIVNNLVTFTDGSWCNVATGQMDDNGPGSISLNTPVQGSEPVVIETRGPDRFNGGLIVADGIDANISIDSYEGTQIEVRVTGMKSNIARIVVNENRGVVRIKETRTGRDQTRIGNEDLTIVNNDSVVIVGSGNSVVDGTITVNGVRIGGGSLGVTIGNDVPTISIKVPRSTNLELKHMRGKVDIGDTDGLLVLSTSGSNDANVGAVRGAVLATSGSGTIHVQKIAGDLIATTSGSGDIRVRDGSLNNLMVETTGSGDFSLDGTAKEAKLTTTGSGDIEVEHVVKQPIIDENGSGNIVVRRVGK